MTDPRDSDNAAWCQKCLDRSEQYGWSAFHCNPLRRLSSATHMNSRSGEGASTSSASRREWPAKVVSRSRPYFCLHFYKQTSSMTSVCKTGIRKRVGYGRLGESEERQINTLLYCLCEEAEDVLTSTNISEADRGRYTQVFGKMDEFFKVQKNVIFERARFNRRTQRQGETAEESITSLYSLAADCQYGNL